ncbi:hypothetical protein BKA69DRAFT_1121952 [Paraphysoderma sedebokerense]|nr:hypothetical protein BKA69DRAFT_1121952 [Paraphysoderma sedebokerense]
MIENRRKPVQLFLLVLILLATETLAQTCSSYRIRKEVRDLTPTELAAVRAGFQTLYNNGVMHQYALIHGMNGPQAHGGANFLAWHREFMYDFETQLLQVTGGAISGLPYWESTLDAANHLNSIVLTEAGFGPIDFNQNCVTSGISANWMLPSQLGSDCLRRGRGAGPGFVESFSVFIQRSGFDYPTFAANLEGTIHVWPHVYVGGSMLNPRISGADPLFYLHHSAVDFWWTLWQDQRGTYDRFEGDHQGRQVTLWDTILSRPAWQVVDYRRLCYRYEPPAYYARNNMWNPYNTILATPSSQIVPSSPMPGGIQSAGMRAGPAVVSAANATNATDSPIPTPNVPVDFLKNMHFPQKRIEEIQQFTQLAFSSIKVLQENGTKLPTLADLKSFRPPVTFLRGVHNHTSSDSEKDANANSAESLTIGTSAVKSALFALMGSYYLFV